MCGEDCDFFYQWEGYGRLGSMGWWLGFLIKGSAIWSGFGSGVVKSL